MFSNQNPTNMSTDHGLKYTMFYNDHKFKPNNDLPKNQKNVRDFKDDKNSYYVTKLNCYKMYDFGQSNKTQKTLNYRSKYYKITENDFNYEDEY